MPASAVSAHSIFGQNFRLQIMATLTVYIMTFSHGVCLGWLSPTLKKLQSTETPLNFDVSFVEASWIGSTIGLGAVAGNIIFGLLIDRLGRKCCLYLLALPHMCFWILVYLAPSVEFLYIARFLGGLTGGAYYVVASIFITEIADPKIRGALSSAGMLFLSFGILGGFVLTSYLSYFVVPCIMVLLPVVYLSMATMFPETPQHLIKTGRLEEAERAFKKYNHIPLNQYCVQFEDLKAAILKGGTVEPVTAKDFFDKPALKAFLTAIIIILQNQFTGTFAFINYMSHIFIASGSEMDPNTCTIIMGVVQIAGTCMATVLVDRFGRKLLLLISALGMTIGYICFGCYIQFTPPSELARFSWVPLAVMSFTFFMASVGVHGLVYVIIVEVLPSKIRSRATSICMVVMSSTIFVALKIFPIFLDQYGIATTMFCCAIVNICCSIYLMFFLKETKGKSMDHD